jgi:general secretion pathway protein L
MNLLRIALAPLHELTADSLLISAALDRQGHIDELVPQTLAQLSILAKGAAVELFLHPLDSVIASLELPPLNTARLSAAASCAAQSMVLGSLESIHLAHSPRGEEGQVQLAWLPRADLASLAALLNASGLKVRGLYPAPYAMALQADGQPVASSLDGHMLVRQGVDQAQVHPAADPALSRMTATGETLHWIGDDAPDSAAIDHLPASARWSGKVPGWGLHTGLQSGQSAATSGWGRAVACCALALVVWVTGLNIYAQRQATEGEALKRGMVQRVRQAFPALPVVLNPLQQARQQITARQSGGDADPDRRFEHLVHQAGLAMPFMVGNLQALTFDQDTLELQILNDNPKLHADTAWQTSLQQAGIQATSNDAGWTLREGGERQVLDTDSLAGNDHE